MLLIYNWTAEYEQRGHVCLTFFSSRQKFFKRKTHVQHRNWAMGTGQSNIVAGQPERWYALATPAQSTNYWRIIYVFIYKRLSFPCGKTIYSALPFSIFFDHSIVLYLDIDHPKIKYYVTSRVYYEQKRIRDSLNFLANSKTVNQKHFFKKRRSFRAIWRKQIGVWPKYLYSFTHSHKIQS